jgi:hypothetical protein
VKAPPCIASPCTKNRATTVAHVATHPVNCVLSPKAGKANWIFVPRRDLSLPEQGNSGPFVCGVLKRATIARTAVLDGFSERAPVGRDRRRASPSRRQFNCVLCAAVVDSGRVWVGQAMQPSGDLRSLELAWGRGTLGRPCPHELALAWDSCLIRCWEPCLRAALRHHGSGVHRSGAGRHRRARAAVARLG